jgi:hypothetical protein
MNDWNDRAIDQFDDRQILSFVRGGNGSKYLVFRLGASRGLRGLE